MSSMLPPQTTDDRDSTDTLPARGRWPRASYLALLAILPACTLFAPERPTFEPRDRPQIEADTTHEATLDNGAVNPRDGTPYRAFEIELTEGDAISVETGGDDFTPTLALYGPDGALIGASTARDDDRSRLLRPVSSTGTHLIVVAAGRVDDTGSFALSVEAIDPPRDTLSYPGETTGIVIGEGDTTGDGAIRHSTHTLEIDEPTAIELVVDADGFEPELRLVDADDEARLFVAGADATAEPHRASMVTALPAGTYELDVTRRGLGADGYYELTATGYDADTPRDFRLDETFRGVLGIDRPELSFLSGQTAQPLAIELDSESVLDVRLHTDSFDGRLLVTDADDVPVVETSTDPTNRADVRLIRPFEPGDYTLWVGSLAPGVQQQGPYRLETERRDPPTAAPIELDTTIDGALTEGSAIYPPRHAFVEYYKVEIDEPTHLKIDLESREFDAYLFVENADSEVVAENDDAHIGTTDARIEREFDPGTYRIGATTFTPDTLGHFELRVIRTIP